MASECHPNGWEPQVRACASGRVCHQVRARNGGRPDKNFFAPQKKIVLCILSDGFGGRVFLGSKKFSRPASGPGPGLGSGTNGLEPQGPQPVPPAGSPPWPGPSPVADTTNLFAPQKKSVQRLDAECRMQFRSFETALTRSCEGSSPAGALGEAQKTQGIRYPEFLGFSPPPRQALNPHRGEGREPA